MNREEPINPIGRPHIQAPDIEVEEPTLVDVRRAIKALKNHKTPGLDNIPAALLKYGGEALKYEVWEIIQIIWRCEEMPGAWDTGNIIPVHKKGDKTICNNYRGITRLPTCYKVLALIIKEKLEPYIEEVIGDYQCGFRRGRSTIDHIFTIRQLMEKYWEYNKEMWQLLIDFKQAYDSVHRESLWNIMAEMRIPNKLIKQELRASRKG